MSILDKHASILGKRVKDRVTGFAGVAASIHFDLYGCIQIAVTPPMSNDGKLEDGRYFDIQRLEITDENRVMPLPSFELLVNENEEHTHGPAEKPSRTDRKFGK